MMKHVEFPIPEEKRPQKYQIFRYLARKPPNIVAEYISRYSKEGEIVLDPFVGSGVTAIEALRLGRKAIAIDLDPIAAFITRMTLKPIDLRKFEGAFEIIKSNIKQKIDKLYETDCPGCGSKAVTIASIWQSKKENIKDEELLEIWYKCPHCGKHGEKKGNELTNDLEKLNKINLMEVEYWYPKTNLYYPTSRPFVKKEKWDSVDELFTRRNLIALSMILDQIENNLPNFDKDTKDLMKFTLASALLQASKFPFVIEKRGKMTGIIKETKEVGSWARPSYWVPPKHFEINAWNCFENRFEKVLRGKKESNKDIERFEEAMNFSDLKRKDKNVMICNRNALDLADIITEKDCVDYVFTDPPYGGSIQYLELATFWASWLKFDLKYDEEITINVRGQGKTFDYYHNMLRAVFERVYEVLKPGRYLTLTFHNTQIKVWNSIIRAVILVGFEHEKTIYQPPLRASAKALRQPYGSVIGDFYIRFKKPEKKAEIIESDIHRERERYERVVIRAATRVLANRGEPTPPGIIITGVMNDLLAEHFYRFGDKDIADVLKRHEGKEFVLVEERDQKGTVKSRKWWFKDPSSVPYLEQIPLNERIEKTIIELLHTQGKVSFTEVMRKIFMDFPNALTPETQSVKDVLNEYAKPVTGGKWILKPVVDQLIGYHSKILGMLVELGEKAGYITYWAHPLPGKIERPLKLPSALAIPKENLERIRKIDVLWYDDKDIVYEFEVENTPIITEAIIRGSNIPSITTKRIMIIPKEYEDRFHRKIHEPVLEEKVKQYGWKFIRYDDLEVYYDQSKSKKRISTSEFDKLHREPRLKIEKQHTLSDYIREN